MTAFVTISGLDFDLFIRGFLVVAVGVVLLMGSIFLILATNSGFRTGLFLALTGVFGWFFIMGMVWTIYGIGYQGRLATWEVVELNRGDLTQADFDEAAELGRSLVEVEGGADTPAKGLQQLFTEAEEAQEPPSLAGWKGMLASNPSRGEAQAAVDAFVVAEQELVAGGYVPVAAFEIGGKPKRPDAVCQPRIINADWGGCPERAWHRIKIALTPRHPAHYAAIMVQAATPASLNARPGEAPPLKEIDPSQPLYTVIMERDLGSKRLPPVLFTLGSGLIFFALAYRLHRRDERELAARAAFSGAR